MTRLDELTAEERTAIRQSLLDWRESGAENPTIPVYADLTGDGIPDFYGLDSNDELVIVPGVTIEESVSLSNGDGLETLKMGNEDG